MADMYLEVGCVLVYSVCLTESHFVYLPLRLCYKGLSKLLYKSRSSLQITASVNQQIMI